jgi:membrane protease YdiL (CAAX protease family)
MVASQLVRLHQADPATWIALDYAGRLGMLTVLATIPAARAVAFRREPLAIAWWEAMLWIVGLVMIDRMIGGARQSIDAVFPDTRFGHYPATRGWLYVVDLVIGLALVAFSEEVLFRRSARAAFCRSLGDGLVMVIATSLLFAAYHWWSGIGNICEALVFGIAAILFYRRAGSLWPVVLAHYLADVANFY